MDTHELTERIRNNLMLHYSDIGKRKLVVWGFGTGCKIILGLMDELREKGYDFPEISFFLDKNPDMQSDTPGMPRVIAPRDIAGTRNEYYILVSFAAGGAAINELGSLGFGQRDYCLTYQTKDRRNERKVAVITGSTKGIGKAAGIKLLEMGCHVVFNYCNDIEAAEKLNRDLTDKGFIFYEIVRADLSSESGLDEFINHIKTTYAETGIDYLICNSRIYDKSTRSFKEITRDAWRRVIDGYLSFVFFMVRDFDGMMNNNGRIIFMSSGASKTSFFRGIPYGVAKLGLNKMAYDLAPYFGERGIAVNSICCSYTYTDFFSKMEKQKLAAYENSLLLKRLTQPDEIASIIALLIENGSITGTTIDTAFIQ